MTTVVGNGTPSSCSEAALNAALVGGGDITFNCGPDPVVIIVTSQKSILTTTSLDGDGRITISGGNNTDIFFVTAQSVTLTLANLTLSNGKATFGGGAVANQGTLNVFSSTLTAN
ncbi:MAG: hypothetical protein Q7T25_10065, partial [Sideroxyarcus sp.]|nr:hypothetical protein [Sideroxyarcus sp.]